MKHLSSMLALICVALTAIAFPITAQNINPVSTTENKSADAQFKQGLEYFEKTITPKQLNCSRMLPNKEMFQHNTSSAFAIKMDLAIIRKQ